MALKTEQVEEIIYKPHTFVTCDASGCESRSKINDALTWRSVGSLKDALYERSEFQFCSMRCLARWAVEAAARA